MSSSIASTSDRLPLRANSQLYWWLMLVAVFIGAFALRWYYVSTAVVIHPIRGDAVQYHADAWNLVHHGVFSQTRPNSAVVKPDNYRDPGYPVLLAAWMRALGDGSAWYAAVLMTQAFLGALTAVLAMQIGSFWLTRKWALTVGIAIALWPHCVTINDYLLTETLFGFLVAAGLLALAAALRRETVLWFAGAGILFGMAALTNAIYVPAGCVLALTLACVFRKQINKRHLFIFALCSLLLPAAWGARNSQLGDTTGSSDRAMQNLVQGAWPQYHSAYLAAIRGNPAAKATLHAIDDDTQFMLQDPAAGLHRLMQRMAMHPVRYLEWYLLRKPRVLWGWRIRIGQGDIYVYPTLNSPFETQPILRAWTALCHVVNVWILLLGLVGLVVAFKKAWAAHARSADQGSSVAVAAIAIYVTVVYCIFQTDPRYSIPFRSVEWLLACTALAVAVPAVRSLLKRKRELAATSETAEEK